MPNSDWLNSQLGTPSPQQQAALLAATVNRGRMYDRPGAGVPSFPPPGPAPRPTPPPVDLGGTTIENSLRMGGGAQAPPPGVPIGEIPGMVGPGGRRPLPPGGYGPGMGPGAQAPQPMLPKPPEWETGMGGPGSQPGIPPNQGGAVPLRPLVPPPTPPPPSTFPGLLPHQEQANRTGEWEDFMERQQREAARRRQGS